MTTLHERKVAFACLLAGIVFFLALEWFGVPEELHSRTSAPWGFGATLLLLTVLAVFIAVARLGDRKVPRRAWWLAGAAALLALDLTIYDAEVVLVLAPLGAVVLLFGLGACLTPEHAGLVGSFVPLRIVSDAIRTILGIIRLPELLVASDHRRWSAAVRDTVVGTLIALPFLAIFALLFAEANGAFGEFLEHLLTEDVWRWISRRIPHAIVALGISGYLTALFLVPRGERKEKSGVWREISPRIAIP